MKNPASPIKLSIVDDHILFRKAIVNLIQEEFKYSFTIEANNGIDLIVKLRQTDHADLPDIVLVDINMPEMDGFETVNWLKKNHPQMKILVLSMYEDDLTIIRMLRMGVHGYLTKNAEPEEIQAAIDSIMLKGYYYTDLVTIKLIRSLNASNEQSINTNVETFIPLNGREREFIGFLCTEMSYQEIADEMELSTRTIDGYRDALFEKIGVKTRVGVVLWAIKYNILTV
ncbi:MAG TPA: response regulator transcription factor [Puia sp.]|jgi:DNA-binding NarL/FixJ family response regulator|nr:response regulator transcription factor [Puia sp.]